MENPVKYLLSIRQRSQGASAVCPSQRCEDVYEYKQCYSPGCDRGRPQMTHCTPVRIWNLQSVYASCYHSWFTNIVSSSFPNHPNLGGCSCRDGLLNCIKAWDRAIPGSNEMQEAMLCSSSPSAVDGAEGCFYVS